MITESGYATVVWHRHRHRKKHLVSWSNAPNPMQVARFPGGQAAGGAQARSRRKKARLSPREREGLRNTARYIPSMPMNSFDIMRNCSMKMFQLSGSNGFSIIPPLISIGKTTCSWRKSKKS